MSEPKEKRWASRALVSMLIREMENYKAAAEVVSGSVDGFALHEKEINRLIEKVEANRNVVTGLELQQVLDEAKRDIIDHEIWEREVLESLPKQHDESGATGPLRQAFAESTAVRKVLAENVAEAYKKYFTEQGG